jgi:phosphomannomutase
MKHAIIFGTDGWRAVIADHFTFANVERVTWAVGRYVEKTYHSRPGQPKVPVLIGYDTRFLADEFARRAAQVLMTMGIPARVACRDVPTPAIAWSVQLEPTAGALQITASHNPPQYCGIKYIPHFAGPATNEITGEIARYLGEFPEDFQVERSPVPEFDPMPPYLEALQTRVDLARIGASGLKVAYDALYSTSRGYLDRILREAGVEVEVLHDWRDPLFGGGMPEPKGEYLKDLIDLVRRNRLDVGVATDGDADRFGVVDAEGNYYTPNQLLALVTRHLVKNRGQKGAVVRTVATTHLLDHIARNYGLELIETPVGFKYIGEMMRTRDVLIGGEESGGASVKGHIPEKDGILANLLLIELMSFEGKPLAAIWNDLLDEIGVRLAGRRSDLHLEASSMRLLMEKLNRSPLDSIAGEKVVKVGRADGLKLYLDEDTWLLIRPSGTEPLIRLYFEGTSVERVDRMVADFKAQVDSVLAGLKGNAPAHDALDKLKARA